MRLNKHAMENQKTNNIIQSLSVNVFSPWTLSCAHTHPQECNQLIELFRTDLRGEKHLEKNPQL